MISWLLVPNRQHCRLSICSFLDFGKYHQKQIQNQSDGEASWLVQSQRLSEFNILKVEQIIISVRAKFIHNLRILKLPSEFKDFVSMVDFHDENVRSSRFSPFNYHQIKDTTNPRYHISNSWNNLPFMMKASQPDDFLEDLRCHFNSCNDIPCTIDKCWVCGDQ